MTETIKLDLTTYRDLSIQIDERGDFTTVANGETLMGTSLHSLKEKIDDSMRAEAKGLTVDLPVLDDEGSACRIIGINLGSGKVITRPAGARGPFVVNILNNPALVAKYRKDSREV